MVIQKIVPLNFDKFIKEIGLDDIEEKTMEMMYTLLYLSMKNKDKVDKFQEFFGLTDEEMEVIDRMFRFPHRLINSGTKRMQEDAKKKM